MLIGYAEAMRNPALVLLYVIPVLVIAFGVFLGIKANLDFNNYDAVQHREDMAKILGNYLSLPSEDAVLEASRLSFESKQGTSFVVMLGGASALLIPIAVTAIGRSHKNAVRELAASIHKP